MLPFALAMMLSVCSATAQDRDLRKAEDSLQKLIHFVHFGKTDHEKYEYNERFLQLMKRTLQNEKSFNYPFDSLKNVARLTAPDGSFRIINWNLAHEAGTFEYFGFIQLKSSKNHAYTVFQLTDRSDETESPAGLVLSHDRWYGALYYKVIEHTHNNRKYYTLLGWDGNNLLTRKKLIEVLTFRSKGTPVFGAQIFRKYKDREKPVRVIFEYSSLASMTLKFEKQYLREVKQRRNRKKGKTVTRLEPMIVFDHLVPLDARKGPVQVNLTGHYQFYVPETNVLDAFVLRAGRWVYVPDVDARNPKEPSKKKKPLPKPEDYFKDPADGRR